MCTAGRKSVCLSDSVYPAALTALWRLTGLREGRRALIDPKPFEVKQAFFITFRIAAGGRNDVSLRYIWHMFTKQL